MTLGGIFDAGRKQSCREELVVGRRTAGSAAVFVFFCENTVL